MSIFRSKKDGSHYPIKSGKIVYPKTQKAPEKPKIKDVKIGMIFKVYDRQFHKEYFARVTKRPYFDKPGDRPDIFYAVIVDPETGKQKEGTREFAIWDFNYSGEVADKWERIT